MANATNNNVTRSLINSSHPLPDGTILTTTSIDTALLATGTTINDAAPIKAQLNRITNNTAANGVQLPVGQKGLMVIIYPQLATNAPKVYPPLGGTIGALAVNANTTAVAQAKTEFYCIDDSGLTWI